jgi:hypothetical protein
VWLKRLTDYFEGTRQFLEEELMSVLWQQRTHGVQRRKATADRTVALFFLSVIVVVTLLSAAYLSLLASNVSLSRRVWEMESDFVTWERTNNALMVEIARAGAIPVLQERSIAMKYVPVESVDFMQITEP